jgi:hypothetical protein
VNLSDVRQALAVALRTTGTRVYPRIPATLEPPALVVELADGEYDIDMTGNHRVNWTIMILATRAGNEERAQMVLEGHLSTGTQASIRDALDIDNTLADNVSYTRVLRWETPGTVTFGEQNYVACEVAVETVI